MNNSAIGHRQDNTPIISSPEGLFLASADKTPKGWEELPIDIYWVNFSSDLTSGERWLSEAGKLAFL